MKRIVSIIIAIVMVTGIAFASTSIIRVGNSKLKVTTSEGRVIQINPLIEIGGWNVKSGNVEVVNNSFTMPATDVEIEALTKTIELTYDTTEQLTKTLKMQTTDKIIVDWGDGVKESCSASPSQDQILSHTYSTAGSYNVKLYGNDNITYLWCEGQKVSAIDLLNAKSLRTLWCKNNQLTELNVENCTELEQIFYFSNNINTINLANNLKLLELDCAANGVTTLALENNVALRKLWCGANFLDSLELNNNTELVYLACENNRLSSLNLSNNTKIENLYCGGNLLTELDISDITELDSMCCVQSSMNTLYVNETQNSMTISDETSCCATGALDSSNDTIHKHANTTVSVK